MRRLSLLAVAASLLFSLAACGDDDSGGPDAFQLPPDAHRAPDARPPADAKPPADAFWAPSAADLGKPCTSNTDCTTAGYYCLGLTSTAGYCTFQCYPPPNSGQPDQAAEDRCANGFPANSGTTHCAWVVTDSSGTEMGFACGIFCGAQWSLPDTCLAPLTCQDKFDAGGQPGTDGQNDVCWP